MKTVLIISASPRVNSNSEALAAEFARGAKEAGHRVEIHSLRGKEIQFCQGCLACQSKKDGHCVQKDAADEIAQQMLVADVLCFATPIYYYSVSGQLKTMLDRTNPLYPLDYQFRDVYLLATAADDAASAVDGAVTALQGWVDCFPKCSIKGVVRGTGVTWPGEMQDKPALAEAFKMGKSC